MEAAARLLKRVKKAGGTLTLAEQQKPTFISVRVPLESPLPAEVLRYEALLDQGFHRDLILLQKLKEMAPAPDTRGGRPLKSEPGLIEGDSIV